MPAVPAEAAGVIVAAGVEVAAGMSMAVRPADWLETHPEINTINTRSDMAIMYTYGRFIFYT
jgi:hypothetical protein